MSSAQEKQLIRNLRNLENSNYTAMAILTLLLWDWVICLDREIKHFWRAKWTLGTWLYFINRFIPTASNLVHITTTVVSWSPEVQQRMCKPTLLVLGCFSALSFSTVQIIMSLRTYALYDCNKPLLAVLIFLSVANAVNQIYWTVSPNSHDLVNTLPAPYNGCLIIGGISPPGWARYIPLLFFEGLLLVLTSIKFVYYMKSGTKALVPKVLFRDGFIGFFAVIAATVFGVIILILRPQPLLTVGQAAAPVAPVLVASRMLLNLRDVMRLSSTMVSPSDGTSGPSSPSRGATGTTQTTSRASGAFGTNSLTAPWMMTPGAQVEGAEGSMRYSTSGHGRSVSTSTMVGGPSSNSTGITRSRGMEWSPTGGSLPVFARTSPHPFDTYSAVRPAANTSNLGGVAFVDESYQDPYAYGADDEDSDEEYDEAAALGGRRIRRPDTIELSELNTSRNPQPFVYDHHHSPEVETFNDEELAAGGGRVLRAQGHRFGNDTNPEVDFAVAPGNTESNVPHQRPVRRPPDRPNDGSESGSVLIIE